MRRTAVSVVCALLLAGCANGSDVTFDEDGLAPIEDGAAGTTTSPEVGVLAVDVGEGGGGSESASAEGEQLSTETGDSPTPTDPAQVSEADKVWALVLAGASDPYDPILADTVTELLAFDLEGRISNCDQGAAEAIGMAADGTFTVTVHFDSSQAADEAKSRLASSSIVATSAEVALVCPE